MLFGFCPCTSRTAKFWHTYVITYDDFMVNHQALSVSIDFPSYSQWDVSFHCIAYDNSCADWNGLYDHLRDVPQEDTFKLSASAAATEFC